MTKRLDRIIFYILLLSIFAGSIRAGERLFIPDNVYYHRFASSADNLEATWINPAGLGISRDIKIQYIGVMGVGALNENWGFNLVGDGVGIGYRSFHYISNEKYREYIFAAGAGFASEYYWGFSYRYVKDGPTIYNKRHFWSLGILYRAGYKLGIGVVLSNLNRGRVDGKRTDIEQLYSFSYRPGNPKITFSMEIALSTGQDLSKANYNYGVEINAYRGVNIYGNVRDNNSFEIGITVNLRKYIVGGQSKFDTDGKYRSTPVFVGYNTGLQHSFIP
jgi:hypothetical protein